MLATGQRNVAVNLMSVILEYYILCVILEYYILCVILESIMLHLGVLVL